MDNPDIVIYICSFLSDIHIIRLLSCNNKLNPLKNRVLFRKKYDILKIKNLSYFDRFVSVSIKDLSNRLPIQIKNLTIVGMKTSDLIKFSFSQQLEKIDIGNCRWNSEFPKFPQMMKELILPNDREIFNYPTPNFDSPFTPDMKLELLGIEPFEYHWYNKTIPISVTKLIFHFNAASLNGKIPNHVTHLEFEYWSHYYSDTEIIPETVQHLRIRRAQRFHVSSISHRKMTLYLPGHWKDEDGNIPLGPDFKIVYDKVKPF